LRKKGRRRKGLVPWTISLQLGKTPVLGETLSLTLSSHLSQPTLSLHLGNPKLYRLKTLSADPLSNTPSLPRLLHSKAQQLHQCQRS
jgi:hypothetical protein